MSREDDWLAARLRPPAALCDPCRAEWLRWLDYRLPRPQRWIVKEGGNPVRQSLDNLEALHRTWRDTIRAQQSLIEEHCGQAHQRPAEDREAA